MSLQGSYKIQQIAINSENEIKRLKAQLDLFWEKELMFYRMFGLKDGMAIVECGSGPGFMMQKFIETFPESHITTVEIDAYLVEIHKKNMQEHLSGRYKIIEQSIMETGFEDNTFDFAIARLVLEHLPDPLNAVREIYRILKPGGKAVFVDNDFELHLRTYPDIPELKDLYNAYCNAMYAEGGNPNIGRQLPRILRNAGFSNIDLQIVSAHNEVVGDEIFLKSEGSGISCRLVKDGYLSQEVLDKISVKWHSLLQKENHSIFRQLFMAVGEKVSNAQGGEKSTRTVQNILNEPSITPEDILSVSLEEGMSLIEQFLCKKVAALINIAEDKVNPESEFSALGFDSLAAVELQNHIKSNLCIDVSITTFLGDQRITDIGKQLLEGIAKNSNNQQGGECVNDSWEEGEI